MDRLSVMGAALVLLCAVVVGCTSTAEGLKQDTEKNTEAARTAVNQAATKTETVVNQAAANTEKAANNAAAATEQAAHNAEAHTEQAIHNANVVTEQTARNTGEAIKEAGRNVADAVSLNTKVTLAIDNDAQLKNDQNHINVETKDGVVHLTGQVSDEAMKQRAEVVAQKTVQASRSPDTVSNELTVAGKSSGQ